MIIKYTIVVDVDLSHISYEDYIFWKCKLDTDALGAQLTRIFAFV